jgi:hypothetical protein
MLSLVYVEIHFFFAFFAFFMHFWLAAKFSFFVNPVFLSDVAQMTVLKSFDKAAAAAATNGVESTKS